MTTTGLQCPTCGHIHPLADVPGQGRFRCAGCQRLLSVPESLDSPPAPPAAVSDPDATRAHPAPAPPRSAHDARPETTAGPAGPILPPGPAAGPILPGPAVRVPAAVRAPVWVLSLAFGFLVSAGLLRVVGLLDVDTVLDAFAGEGVGRYGALLVLLPLWAVLSAGAAHLVLEWFARRRKRGPRTKSGRGGSGGQENPQRRKDEGARRAV
jgi:hypothetical protein